MQGALLSPLFEPKVAGVVPSCPTQNCRFGPFYTLGYCSRCDDVSDRVVIQNDTIPFKRKAVCGAGTGSHDSSNYSCARQNVSYLIPANESTVLSSGYLPTAAFEEAQLSYDSGADYPLNDSQVVDYSRPTGFMNITTTAERRHRDPDNEMTVLGAFLNGAPWQYPNYGRSICPPGEDDWSCRGYGAARCSLRVCIQKVVSIVVNNTLQETVLDARVFNDSTMSYANASCLLEHGLTNLSSIPGGLSSISDNGVPDNFTLGKTPAISFDGYDLYQVSDTMDYGTIEDKYRSCVFSVGRWAAQRLVKFHGQTYAGAMSQGEVIANDTGWGWAAQQWFPETAIPGSYTNVNGTVCNSSYVSQLFHNGQINASTLNASFASVAHSASVYMRQNGAAGGFSEPALGTAQAYVVVYKVRWLWLIYLVVAMTLVLCTFVPTAIMLFRDRARPEKDWKGNILPLLLYGLDDSNASVKSAQQRKLKIDEIEELAKKQKVEMIHTGGGWKFA